jgi:hypothetical protein
VFLQAFALFTQILRGDTTQRQPFIHLKAALPPQMPSEIKQTHRSASLQTPHENHSPREFYDFFYSPLGFDFVCGSQQKLFPQNIISA